MDIALKQGFALDLDRKVKSAIETLKFSKIEQMLSDYLENMPDESPINLIGELNKSDIMH